MKLTRSHRLVTLCLLATIYSASACSKKEPAPKSDTTEARRAGDGQLDFVPTEEERKAIDALLGHINPKTRRFAYGEARKKSNAKLFTYLAATSDDPVVIAASLQAIQAAYSHRSSQKEAPDADLDRVLTKHLGSKEPEILGRALMASRISLMRPDPNPKLVEAIVKLAAAHTGGPGRYGILEALSVLQASTRTPEVIGVFRSSLESSEPYVLSTALHGLQQGAGDQAAAVNLRSRVLELAEHEDPGVRGRAIQVLSSLGSNDHPETIERTRAALEDEHPYVRAEACEALARLGHEASIHELMARIDDKERGVYDLRGWTLLDGRPGNVRHRVTRRTQVQESALDAIARLSDGQLTLEKVDRKQGTASLEKNVSLTKAWYAKTKSTLAKHTAQPNAVQAKQTAEPKQIAQPAQPTQAAQ